MTKNQLKINEEKTEGMKSKCALLIFCGVVGATLTGARSSAQWTSEETASYLLGKGTISVDAARKVREHGITFSTLFDIVNAADAEALQELSLPSKGLAMYKMKADMILLQQEDSVEVAVEPMVEIEPSVYVHMDFYEVRAADRSRFDAFLTGCSTSPQATILAYYVWDWDFLQQFIDDDTTSVTFWLQWLFVPNWLAARMIWHFSDTNLITSTVYAMLQVLSFGAFILHLAKPDDNLEKSKNTGARAVTKVLASWSQALVSVLLWRILISYVLFGWFEDLLFYGGFFLIAGQQLIMIAGVCAVVAAVVKKD